MRALDVARALSEKIKDKESFHRLDALRYTAAGYSAGGGVVCVMNDAFWVQ